MSWQLTVLNTVLRRIERPYLEKRSVRDVDVLRRRFERATKWALSPPKSVRSTWMSPVAGIQTLETRPTKTRGAGLILYFHGGGYFMGSPNTVRNIVGRLCAATGVSAWTARYPLAPEQPFPAAFECALTLYDAAPKHTPIVLAGDSAGGGLAFALLAEICRTGRSPPCLTVGFSPWVDLTLSGESVQSNAATEVLLPPEKLVETVERCLDGANPKDPRASALFGSFTGARPVFLLCSPSEILRDDTRRLAKRLRAQDVAVQVSEYPGCPHVWPMFAGLVPEADAALREVAEAISTALGTAHRAKDGLLG